MMRTAEGGAVAQEKPSIEETPMKRNILFALVAMALGGVGVAEAQSGTWYIAPRIGYIEPDSNRTTDGNLYSGIGVGVWASPNWAVDFEYAIKQQRFQERFAARRPPVGKRATRRERPLFLR
jgi:hypothetical protein